MFNSEAKTHMGSIALLTIPTILVGGVLMDAVVVHAMLYDPPQS